ncbi:MAG: ATP-dependent DNA helicase RecG [Chloroflexota bacterium]
MVATSPVKRSTPPVAHDSALLERVRKVLLHEQRTGFGDRAVVGGLGQFVSRLHPVAELSGTDLAWLTAAQRQLGGYAALSSEARKGVVSRLLAQLDGGVLPATSAGEAARAAPKAEPPRRASPEVGATRVVGGATSGAAALPERPVVGETSVPERPIDNDTSIPERRGVRGATVSERRSRTAARPVARSPRVSRTAPREEQRRTRAAARVVAPLSPQAPIGDLPGIGPRAVASLARLQVHSVRDLLYHLPRRHLDRRSVTAIADLVPGEVATVYGTVWQVQTKRSPVQGRLITEAILQDDGGFCHAVWFNQPYLVRTLSRPGQVLFSGKVEYGRDGAPQLAAPEFEFDSDNLLHTGRLVPFYAKTEGLSDKQLRTWARLALEATDEHVHDPLPDDVRRAERLLDLGTALAQAHFPDDDERLAQALRRLAFDEFLLIQLGVLRRRREWQETQPGVAMRVEPGVLDDTFELLPFAPTGAQRRVVAEITADMARPAPMSRLLQGEVGSGKTVVAATACLVAVRSGYQAAMMAPTEVLAQQHHRTVSRILAPFGLRVELVSGSLRRKEKTAVWAACAAGEIDILIGTHALIQDEGDFKQLGLVVVDEQHRFGVRQRGALRRKGYNPDVLVMTATPIPRTLALSVYGDLDISAIDELPPGRREIKTFPVSPDHRHRAYEFLRKQVRGGRQGFIICPLIDESDKVEARAAKGEYERLRRQFPDLRLALLHGKMPPKDKEAVMVAFRDGATDVLVSTAVVEVGIDVPNATVMLIEGADRFGLAQLHQFRGRVGRGEHQSYCLLLSDSPGAEENPRLRAVVANHDGFALAEEDLKLRGPGEFFGTRQSGLPDLKVAKLSDVAVLEAARRQAQAICERDPDLERPEHAALRTQVDAFWRTADEAA